MKEVGGVKSELTAKIDGIKVPFSGQRLDSAEVKISELQLKTDDLADTHHRLLQFVDKQDEDGAGKLAAVGSSSVFLFRELFSGILLQP